MSNSDLSGLWVKINFKKLIESILTSFAFKIVVASTFTALITVLSITHPNAKNMLKWWILFISAILVHGALCIIIAYCEKKKKEKEKVLADIKRTLDGQSSVTTWVTKAQHQLTEHIKRIASNGGELDRPLLRGISSFQNTAFYVCEEIRRIITSGFDCDKSEVTVIQQFEEKNNRRYVTMVAYSCKDKPGSFKNKYYLTTRKSNVPKPYYVKIFNQNEPRPYILDKKGVQENFVYIKGSKAREKEICYYIGLPVRSNSDKIAFVLQIDVSKENVFGKTEKEVQNYIDNVFNPFIELLHLCYQQDGLVDTLLDLVDNISVER